MFEDRKDAGKKLAKALEQVYRNWYDVSDEEVLEIMNQWKNKER
jgi:predicted phosphoribosyltransferase